MKKYSILSIIFFYYSCNEQAINTPEPDIDIIFKIPVVVHVIHKG